MKTMRLAGASALALALALTACASPDNGNNTGATPDPTSNGGGEEVTLTVGLVPVVNVAPLHLGIEKGFFEEVGITIDPVTAQTFAANVASVMNGESQIGFGATVPLIVAFDSGVPLQLVSNSDVVGPTPDGDNSGLFVAEGSGIESMADLEGKTVAINALSNVHDVAIKSAMIKAGADADSVQFLEVALPDMVAALSAKRVDAIALGEPFVTAALEAGFPRIVWTYEEGYELGTPIGSYFTSQEWAAENPEVLERFASAMEKATQYALDNPEEARAIVANYTQIPPPVLEKVTLGTFSAEIEADRITELAELMVETDTIGQVPDIERLVGGK